MTGNWLSQVYVECSRTRRSLSKSCTR